MKRIITQFINVLIEAAASLRPSSQSANEFGADDEFDHKHFFYFFSSSFQPEFSIVNGIAGEVL